MTHPSCGCPLIPANFRNLVPLTKEKCFRFTKIPKCNKKPTLWTYHCDIHYMFDIEV